jgi:pSer/pThr/pTyr-binding forkhead associated (FHA) protein
VHGRGYAFCGLAIEKRDSDPGPTVIVIFTHGPRRIVLHGGVNVIGRGEDSDAVIDHPEISRHHARVTIASRSATIEDLGSKNGTFVCDKRISAAVELHDADVVRLGTVSLDVRVMLRSAETKTARGS